MTEFMGKDFLLHNDTAKQLFHTVAEDMPIVDYHCHISPREIAEDRSFENITQLWLGGDHYKWRLMRANGVEEKYITGDATDREKFQKWAETLEKAPGNPVFQWSHLELQRYFDYHGVLNGETAEDVWNLCNEKLQSGTMSARQLIINSNVKLLCTTDDPADDLRWHRQIREDTSFPVQVLPTFRPEKATDIEKPAFAAYIRKLGDAAGMDIQSFEDLKAALRNRALYFKSLGCRISDHSLDYVMYQPVSEKEADRIFENALAGKAPDKKERLQYQTMLMLYLAGLYRELGFAMQIHFGVKRNNNQVMYQKIGPDTGFDCIRNGAPGDQLADFLNACEESGGLPKTILYSLNPNDNAMIDSIIACFQNSDAVGKIQHGAAWWFNDNRNGMVQQMSSLANDGLLGNFIGMLTDSRSFISYARHEYFRRVFCDLLGGFVEDGMYPDDPKMLEKLVRGVSYENAVRYFGFSV